MSVQKILKNPDPFFRLLVLFTGISSIVTQLMTIRECYAQFHGNVYVIGMIFFVWLIAGAAGTLLVNFCSTQMFTNKNLGILCIVLATMPGIQILVIRLLRQILFIPGTEIGFYHIFLFVSCTFWPYALLIGFALPFTYFVAKNNYPAFQIAGVYIYDSTGDALGGFLFSFVLVHICTPVMAVSLVNMPLLMSGFYLLRWVSHRRKSVWLLIVISTTIFVSPLYFEYPSLKILQKEMVLYKESSYGRIQLFQDKGRFILVTDGIPTSNERNIAFEESIVHFGLCQVNKINRVLTISANPGILIEIQKYQPLTIDNIEIDAVKSAIYQQYGFLPHYANLRCYNADGRQFIQETKNTYDAIILNLPEPDTFEVNRFYTQTFFKIVHDRLSQDGVLVFCIDSFASYLSDIRIKQVSTMYQTALTAFEHVGLFPGEQLYFVCGKRPVKMTIPEILSQKSINTQYIQYSYYGDISNYRVQYLQNQLIGSVPVNQDNLPVLVRITVENWLAAFHTDITLFIIVIFFLWGMCAFLTNTTEFVLFSSGMTVMGFEILLIFLFQMRLGNVYYQVCWIVTCFLIGLVPGAYLSGYLMKDRFAHKTKQIIMQCDLGLIIMIIAFLVSQALLPYRMPLVFFLGYGFFLSMLCGFQFPLALQSTDSHSKRISRFFAADILGAAFGIILVSVIGIPFYGLIWTALGLGLIKLIGLLRIMRNFL